MISFLPHEQHRQDEVKKVFARAATLEPAESSPKHVHPNLPDHNDLAARPQEEDKDIIHGIVEDCMLVLLLQNIDYLGAVQNHHRWYNSGE
ncbi:hypothetical protein RJT34_22684 [Clitoria ternatea]|uniref:Uncharacterized protein n=1 Tax=Clitoria ternatea TaxID=43366 RepID=A0AAN9FL52_CLITE